MDVTPLRLLAYTDADEFGGAERCLANVLAGLSDHVTVSIVGVHAEVVARVAAERPETATRTLPRPGGDADVHSLARHVRMFRALRPDVCHVNLRSPASCEHGIIAALLAPRAGVVAVEHLPHPFGGIVRRWVKRRTARRLDAYVATSDRSAREIEQLTGLRDGAVRTIHNGVPPAPAPASARLAPGPTIGSVGRLDRQKGFDLLIRAVARLSDVTLVIVGDGPLRGELEALSVELGVRDRVILTGWLEEPRALFGTFDVLAQASRYESFPLALLEAMHAGTPIVATSVGGVPEMLEHGRTGLVVPPEHPDALAAALERLLGDPELRRRLGVHAREVAVARFGTDVMCRAYEALYGEIAGG